MTIFRLIFILCCFSSPIVADSIVSPSDYIDDFKAKRAYATALMHNPQTVSEALLIFEELAKQKPHDAKLQWELLMAKHALAEQKGQLQDSLVPREAFIDDYTARKEYARALSRDPSKLAEALTIFEMLNRQNPSDYRVQWELLKTRYKIAQKAPLDEGSSLIPSADTIDDNEAFKGYAAALAHDVETLPEALEVYQKLFAQKPEDYKLQWEILKAQYTLSHREEATLMTSLVPKSDWINDYDARLSYAQILATIKHSRREALKQFYILLEQKPHDPLLLLDLAKVYLDEGLYPEALCIIKTLDVPAGDVELQLKMAQIEAELGYAKASRNRYLYILSLGKETEKVLDYYAHGMMSWGDYYGAEKIYAENLQQHPDSIEAQSRYIGTYIAQQRYAEAEELSLSYLTDDAKSQKEMLLRLIEIKRLQKDHYAALAYTDQFIQAVPDEFVGIEIKASIFYEMKCYEMALPLLQQLTLQPDFRDNAYLMLGKAYFRLDQFEQAASAWHMAAQDPRSQIYIEYYLNSCSVFEPAFVEGIIQKYPAAQQLHIWADLYAQDGLLPPMLQIYQAVVCMDPDYFPGQLNLADALANELDFILPRNIYNDLLCDFPDNYKLLLNRARVVSWDKRYTESLKLYDELIALNCYNLVPKLEQARVAYWGKYYDLSMDLYRRLLADTSGDGPAMQFLHRQYRLEMKVTSLRWNTRTMHSLKYYMALLCADPGSALWKFEYAQALCALGLCEDSMDIYKTILDENPLHTLAALNLERQQMKTRPAIGVNYNWWQERGYGELSQIGRYEVIAMYEYPLACNHHLRFGERRYLEHTYFDGKYHSANGQTIEWDCRYNAFVSAAAAVTRKHYLERCFGTTYTGKAEVWIDYCDKARLGLGFKKIDEVHNYFNLVQTTQGRIWWANLQTNINHWLCFDTLYEHEDYNDGNQLEHVAVQTSYAFTEHPRVFKVTASGEFRDTRHNNIFIYNANNQLVNIIYPYWAPQSYMVGQVQLEWRHDYADLEFCGAPVCFYDLKLACGNDTDSNIYWEIKGEWQHEFYTDWKVGASFYIHRSVQWDGNGLWCNLDYRF